MEKLSYYNEIIVKLNTLRADFDETIRVLRDSKVFDCNFINPIDKIMRGIYKLKDLSDKSGFDVFGEESYLKYIYISYFEFIIEELIKCLSNCLMYLKSNYVNKMLHKKLVVESIDAFNDYNELLNNFAPECALEYYAMLIDDHKSFDFFKPGMYYKFLVFMIDDMKNLDLEYVHQASFARVMKYVDAQEEAFNVTKDMIDFSTYDKKIEDKSKQYHVDFVGLDKNYTAEKEETEDEKDKGNSRTRK